MPIQIAVKNLQKRLSINPSLISQKIKKVLLHKSVKSADLSIVFITDQRIKTLNKKYLAHDYATDVLAFGFNEKLAKLSPKALEGEIFVSVETAVKNAKKYQASAKKETMLYVIHGILHLLGFDDHKKADIQRMHKEEQSILKLLKI